MSRGGGELNAHCIGEFVQLDEIVGVAVAQGDAEADIANATCTQSQDRPKAVVEAVGQASQLVVGRWQPF